MSDEQEFYTAAEARKVLGLTEATFFWRVRQGHIPKVIPPGRRQAGYPKKTIDALAQAMQFCLSLKSTWYFLARLYLSKSRRWK